MKFAFFSLILGLLSLAACAPADSDEAPEPTSTSALVPPATEALAPTAKATTLVTPALPTPAAAELTATETAVPEATNTPAPSAGESPAAVTFGRTAEGAFFHGSPVAPVTLIDYSDFF